MVSLATQFPQKPGLFIFQCRSSASEDISGSFLDTLLKLALFLCSLRATALKLRAPEGKAHPALDPHLEAEPECHRPVLFTGTSYCMETRSKKLAFPTPRLCISESSTPFPSAL